LLKESPFGEEVVMTTQPAPHTPLWRRFFSLPRTRLGKWAAWLFAASVPLYTWVILFAGGPMPNPHGWVPDWLGWAVTALGIVLALSLIIVLPASGVVSSLALGSGERSILVWLAQIPTVLFVLGLLTVFEQRRPWWQLATGVLVWFAIAAGLGYLKRTSTK
jgi:hypothetical protein